MGEYLLIFFVTIILSIIFNYLAVYLANRMKLIDYPGSADHKTHKRPTPMSGGISIALTFLVYVIFLPDWLNREWAGIFLGAGIIFLFGLWDDIYKFGYSTKLFGQFFGAMILIVSGTHFNHFDPEKYKLVNYSITVLWVVGVVNAFNFIDSMDNIVIGLSIIGFSCLVFLGGYIGLRSILVISLILLGISIVSYFFNRTPAKMFLGDSGAQTLGFFMATLCILYTMELPFTPSTFMVPLLLTGVPIFNLLLVIFSRVRRHIPVYRARLDQVYNRLVSLGYKQAKAVSIIQLSGLVLNIFAIIIYFIPSTYAVSLFIAVIMVGFSLLFIMDDKKRWI